MSKLKEIIDWLTCVEESAGSLYERAAIFFQADPDLAELLRQLASDERLHHELMLKAGAALGDLSDFTTIVSLDTETRRKVEKPFAELSGKLDAGVISREELLNYLITLEFSELNHIFLYIMNSLKEVSSKQFASAALNVEQHKDRICCFVAGKPGFETLMKRVGQLPRVLKQNILIVDDIDVNRSLLKAVLEGEGLIENAKNGNEALSKVDAQTFSAIVADVDMPVMDGIEFYKRAVDKYPQLKYRFVFITGAPDPERVNFFQDNKLKFLTKPAPISEIRRTVREVMHACN
ncbi:MAG: hypothetical protein A2052_10150 [Deltaproteobacteria bacterium GWA2_54_12]|nr:MAG: hypothetical protein A2052_10150 [Deltaproteobacteria bacterium GWA2_54_12]